MCGIVGFSSKSTLNPDKILYLMYQNSIERGRHSTGFYTPLTGVKKDAKVPEDFFCENPIPITNTFIGHVRQATVGAKTKKNAHPFEYENIVGVHNGTLDNMYQMLRDRKVVNTGIDVDSQAIYKLLDEDSCEIKPTWDTLSEFDGAAALLFQDKRYPKSIYAYRNNDRTLYYGFIDKSMYISSIGKSLEIIGCKQISLFDALHLYRIEEGQIKSRIYHKEYVKPKVIQYHKKTEHTSREEIFRQLNQSGYHDTSDQHCSVVETKEKEAIRLANLSKSGSISNIELVGKWLQVFMLNLKTYYKTDIILTEGDWYFIRGIETGNNYDVIIKDDMFQEVVVPKWIFNMNYLNFEDWVVTTNIICDKNDDKKVIFSEDVILEIYDSAIIILDGKPHIEIHDPINDRNKMLPTRVLRPATKEEIETHCKKLKEESKNKDESPFINSNVPEVDKADAGIFEFWKGIIPDNHNSQDIDEAVVLEEENNTLGDLIPEEVYVFALSMLVEKVVNIQEILDTTNHKELVEQVDELGELLEELHDIGKLEQFFKEEEEEQKEREKSLVDVEIK